MKTYHNIEEVKADIKGGVLKVDDDIEIAFNGFEIDADIICRNIYSKDYERNINAKNINAVNIIAWNINAVDINAGDINAGDINAGDITAGDINAWEITAGNISYNAFCCVYGGIKCTSIKVRRENAHKPICLDGKLEIESKTFSGKEVDITIDGKTYKAIIKE